MDGAVECCWRLAECSHNTVDPVLSDPCCRRVIAKVKTGHRSGCVRCTGERVSEPGMCAPYDFGDGPQVAGVTTILLCA